MMFKKIAKPFALALILAGCLLGSAGAVVLDTTGLWNGSDWVAPFGSVATFGQVVTAPEITLLDFTFYMKQSAFQFAGYVYEWDGLKAVGPQLYYSGPMSTTGSDTFEAITFDTGGVSVTPGTKYVLFASVANFSQPVYEEGKWGYLTDKGSLSSHFVFDLSLNPATWTTTTWDFATGQIIVTGDTLAFKATFSDAPVPLPGAVLLLGSALGRLAFCLWRRQEGKP